MNFERIPVDDYILKYHTLKRGIENLRRNLQATMVVLDDKSNLEELQRQTKEQSKMKRLKSHVTEDEMLLNIRAEAILSRLLKENLFSRELEYEQLQADFARSIRARDVLQNANQRLQDEVSCLSHKMKDLELQILKKDETIAQLHQEIQTSMTDLNAVQSMLQTVSTENNELWEEVKRLRKTNMVLENEIVSLRKKIESLEEDILLKEGQICILKDSLEKPFDTLYTTKGMKEFILE
ncbi:spindle pole body component 110-like [Zingiber officinale]|uniref:spindle pole body component 110-like n=1 Tax=Zingiber officinale TaxID=94328 RepID=UPI001C4B31B0|nr:spindle pole body component 110-like [Zingiber officinale]